MTTIQIDESLCPLIVLFHGLSSSPLELNYIANVLKKNGFRVASDLRNEKITYKIREHSLQKLPYLLVAGEREMQSGQVAVRTRKGEDLGSMPLQAFIERLQSEVEAKGSAA